MVKMIGAMARHLVKSIFPRAVWPPLQDRCDLFAGKKGLEIGGPSEIFRRYDYLPVYDWAVSVDGCNFSQSTVWHAHAPDGDIYRCYGREMGRQHIREATELTGIPDSGYDFVLASHVLEHIANPLKALGEWRRVLRPNGAMIVVVPDRHATPDRKRPVTGFDHLVQDFEADIGEDDLTHVNEILLLHDLGRYPLAGGADNFARRSRDNVNNRCLHHHVFDQNLLSQTLAHSGFEVEAMGLKPPFHIVALAMRIN